jgi:hypothetical protein
MQRTGGIARGIYAQQAQIAGNFDLIIEHLKEAFDRPNGLLCEDRCFGRPGANSYLFKVPTLGFNLLPDGWTALNDPVLKKTYYYHEETSVTTWERPTPNAQPNPEVPAQENLTTTRQGGIEATQPNDLYPCPRGTKHYAQLKSNKKKSRVFFGPFWAEGVMSTPC